MHSAIDHLVVACADLDQGAVFIRDKLGASVQAGGKHITMGTHNRLLKLGDRVYLEVIAIDPEAASPARPRWFTLDSQEVQTRMEHQPFLLTWVMRCHDLPQAAMQIPMLGEVHAMTRNQFSWRVTVPKDGSLPFDGVFPTIIQWDEGGHPASLLDEQGCHLLALAVSHPEVDRITPLFHALSIDKIVSLTSGAPGIVARIQTPIGVVEL